MLAKPFPANNVSAGRACAALAYIFPVGLVWYFTDGQMRRNRFAAFHVHQSLAAALVFLVGWFLGTLLAFVFVGVLLHVIIGILGVVWFVQGLHYALHDREETLWLVGGFGRRFDF